MATNQRKRQRKLERRAEKRKERRKELVVARNRGLAEQLADAATAPILDCVTTESLWEQGMASVLISRELPRGKVAAAVFLVDRYCLGVKDAFGRVMSRGEYSELYDRFREQDPLIKFRPEDARQLVEGAVAYARGLGFEPHPDYQRVKAIFGDINPADSSEEFQFGGDEGKPYFIAGPHDDTLRCQRILRILEHACGPDGFHFTVPLERMPDDFAPEGRVIEAGDEEDYEDDDEYEDEDGDGDDWPPRLP